MITSDSVTQFNSFFGGLASAVRRQIGKEAIFSIAAVGPGSWRCVIFESNFHESGNLDEAAEVPVMYVGTGATAAQAFDQAMEKAVAHDVYYPEEDQEGSEAEGG
jgi:hypothetical protein